MVEVLTDYLALLPVEPIENMGELMPYVMTVGLSVIMAGMVFRTLIELVKTFVPWRWGL